MGEGFKVFLLTCGWAVVCRLGMELLPKGQWPLGIYAAVCLSALIWLIPAFTVGIRDANYFLKLTLGIWAGTIVCGGAIVLSLS